MKLPIETIDFHTGERIEYITKKELDLICNALWSQYRILSHRKSGKKHLRDCFIFSFLFFTGVRTTEFLLSKKYCIDFNEMNYYVPQLKKSYWKKEIDSNKYMDPYERFKNGLIKYVIIPIDHVPNNHLKYWKEYLKNRDIEEFLVDIKGRQLRNIIYENSKRWINRKIHPHALRHSLGVYLADELKLPVQDIQRIMRHTNPEITFRYVRLKQSDLKEKLRDKNVLPHI